MDKKKLILLVAALVVAIGTALAARSMFAGAATPEAAAVAPVEEPQGPKVLVAKRNLPAGTIITADAMSYQLWPQELVQDAYYIDGETNMEQLLGTVVRLPITAGEPVTQGSLVAPGDRGFLAAALGPGMRAVTISVTPETGVGGFIFPGDRVDLMLTQTIDGEEGQALRATETIVNNLRVLATDQSTTTTTTEDGQTVAVLSQTVTLEVTPRIAEKVSVARAVGTLGLSLRSIADNQAELERAIAAGEVDVPANATPEEEERILRQVVARPHDRTNAPVTGGDVSRFQRRSMPVQTSRNANAAPAAGSPAQNGYSGPSRPSGPTVRVTRGKTTTEEAVSRSSGSAIR
jgi:pilus assembly protein CpaB